MRSADDSSQRQMYEQFPRLVPGKLFLFMNHGYAHLRRANQVSWLRQDDRRYLFHVQLLDQVLLGVALKGRDVLEVGSGRGGNCAIIARYMEPKVIVGLEYSKAAVEFSTRTHHLPRLQFVEGSALDLPFEKKRFDVLVNIESSHCYPSLGRFYREVRRVLRDEGRFCYSDCSPWQRVALITEELERAGFAIHRQSDITANVLRALTMEEAEFRGMLFESCQSAEGRAFARRLCKSIFRDMKEGYASGRFRYTVWQSVKRISRTR